MIRRGQVSSAPAIFRLARDKSGATLMEFAFVAPVFMLLLMGFFDLGQLFYARSVLSGAVQLAARNSSLETGDSAAEDASVKSMVQKVAPGATLVTSRSSYYDFSDLKRAEKWNDANGNGICDNSEAYSDENGNGSWDADIGKSGNGGAGDVVMYSATLTYDRLFKVPLMPGSKTQVLTASAIRKNQPFSEQQGYGTDTGTCG